MKIETPDDLYRKKATKDRFEAEMKLKELYGLYELEEQHGFPDRNSVIALEKEIDRWETKLYGATIEENGGFTLGRSKAAQDRNPNFKKLEDLK